MLVLSIFSVLRFENEPMNIFKKFSNWRAFGISKAIMLFLSIASSPSLKKRGFMLDLLIYFIIRAIK